MVYRGGKKSKIFDEIIVSTDSKKISNIAIKYGAKIPFLRSSKLSNDKSNLIEVMSDVAKFYLKKKNKNKIYMFNLRNFTPIKG